MRKSRLLLLCATIGGFVLCREAAANDLKPTVDLHSVNEPCGSTERPCESTDALFFVHGIYGSAETFLNKEDRKHPYNWPAEIAKKFGDRTDVYTITYGASLMEWAKAERTSFDEIAYEMFKKIHGSETEPGLLHLRNYRSIAFIAHSLGGNFTSAYIHSVKSEFGHEDRARIAFLVTLGTPANGSQIANVGLLLKGLLGRQDRLLKSLENDNTFLRMMAAWRRGESIKASRFRCRPVNLYVAVEGRDMFPGIRIVSEESAALPYAQLAKPKLFPYDHARIAKPRNSEDELNIWVETILEKERKRIDEWGSEPLCERRF